MSKHQLEALLLKHDEEITQLRISTGQMVLIWRAVGMLALVAVGAWLSKYLA